MVYQCLRLRQMTRIIQSSSHTPLFLLREHPLALGALTGLLSLGMRGADVIAYIMNGIPQASYDWYMICDSIFFSLVRGGGGERERKVGGMLG